MNPCLMNPKLLREVIQELETICEFSLKTSGIDRTFDGRKDEENEKNGAKEGEKEKKQSQKDILIRGIAMDSRKVEPGFIFVAIQGQKTDGHEYLDEALERGAVCLVMNEEKEGLVQEGLRREYPVPVVFYRDTTVALSLLCKILYGDPSSGLTLIGITGTNGKTTTSYMIREILKCAGKKTGLLGTIACSIGEKSQVSSLTTPDPLSIYAFLSQAQEEGIEFVVMEISSHAIVQNRVLGLELDALIVTSFSEDHLDFHRTMEEYLSAKLQALLLLKKSSKKKKLFLMNQDMSASESFLRRARELELNIQTYALEEEESSNSENLVLEGIPLEKSHADYIARKVELEMGQSSFFLEETNLEETNLEKENLERKNLERKNILIENSKEWVSMAGRFNVYNSLASWALCRFFGISVESIRKGLRQVRVPGRFERVGDENFSVIVDYAHTDDALWNVLSSIRDLLKGKQSKHRILTVFGCGGDRDREKRPIMGQVASNCSDFLFVTSDNPRGEDPMQIIEEVLVGVRKQDTPYEVIPDRQKAIQRALELAQSGDILLIAGKGHENYQILKDRTIHFDDREEVLKILAKRKSGS